MQIKHIAIHVVQREKDGEDLKIKLRSTLNTVSGQTEKLSKDLASLFSTATMNIGEFALDGDADNKPPFEIFLEKFYDSAGQCTDFLSLSKELAQRYKSVIDRRKLTTVKGGYLIFFDFEYKGSNMLSMAVLRKSSGVDISDSLEVISSESIDLSKLHLGASINLSRWRKGIDTRYIKFKVGSASDVRDYFQDYIGCQRDKEAAIIETDGLKDAIKNFVSKEFGEDKVLEVLKLENAHSYIKEVLKKEDRVLLSNLAKILFPDRDTDFLKFVSENHSIGEEILIDKKGLRRFLVFSGKSDGISLSFPREMLQKEVVFENEQLIFKKIPDDLKKEIISELQACVLNLVMLYST